MPYKDKEKDKECKRQWYLNNKEKRKQDKNIQKQIKEYKKQYRQTEPGKKSRLICHWKQRGLKLYGYTYEEVYEYYLSVNICEHCEIPLNTNFKTQKCMDHCHYTGCFRWVLCQSCNVKDNWINKLT